ncbi:hypothetical protein ACFRCI_28940 [Streptomyces sp. NPDC056638]|uniref:hypothetical protein n=1 Tax=Streptomyces sp. NPDC056638 TaxID=3345887 RepID=UPI0036B27523
MKLLVERVRGIEEAREQAARNRRDEDRRAPDRRAADRRFTALIVPVLLLILTVYPNAQGAGA